MHCSECRPFNSTMNSNPCNLTTTTDIFFPDNDTFITDRDTFIESLVIFKLLTFRDATCGELIFNLICDTVYPRCDNASTPRPRAPCPTYCNCVLNTKCQTVWNQIAEAITRVLDSSLQNPQFNDTVRLANMVKGMQQCSGNRVLELFRKKNYSENCVTEQESGFQMQCAPTPVLGTIHIIAIAVGGGVGVIILLCLIITTCCCCCCYRRRHRHPVSQKNLDHNHPLFPESGYVMVVHFLTLCP